MTDSNEPSWKTNPRCDEAQLAMLRRRSEAKDITEWNDWREANPRVEIWLQGADLRNAYLRMALLDNVHLEGADFGQADLEGATFERAHLEGAAFRGATLKRAKFQNAHLDGGDLREAHLEDARL